MGIIPNSIIPTSIMKDSPFIYGTTVSNYSFTNREAEIKKLKYNLKGGINTTIISPRRWGKSSLVEKVISDINASGKRYRTVVIDLFVITSEEEFLEIYAREIIKASATKWEDWVKNAKAFFKQLIPKIQLSADAHSDFSLSFDWQEIKKHSEEILNLPETIGKQRKINFIVCIDEFQNLSNIQNFETFEKKLRALWQRHKNVTYCLYGSKRHMMTNIFNNPSKPFYRFGDIMLLPKITSDKWIEFICLGFKKSKKEINKEEAAIIVELMQNHSWYVQQLSHYTWNMTKKIASKKEIQAALNELINANSPLYQKEIEILSNTQLNLLKAVALGETQLTAARVMQLHNLGTPRNVSKNKTILINNDIIQHNDNKYEFLDPAFELWFRQYFLNKAYQNQFK